MHINRRGPTTSPRGVDRSVQDRKLPHPPREKGVRHYLFSEAPATFFLLKTCLHSRNRFEKGSESREWHALSGLVFSGVKKWKSWILHAYSLMYG
ncbi:hypothetical protein CEXT_358691 [Caerostris extrusa]|uniref:Uncharacterized protein n=1 Tax=Caerostris extrusa TaxID=172846 RepID=A0AAV4R3S5_CAEEX|nr:hypothetical protein CEXT_358691 [Caerostris extrusa]